MLYLKVINGAVMAITEETQTGEEWQSRWDWKSFETVEQLAESATLLTGELYIPIDAGQHVSPRYEVIKAPKVGDEVSYCFNGDCYEDGEIVKISKTLKVIETTSGNRYYRKKQSGSWVQGGTWTLVHGHVNKRNPHL